MDIDLWRDFRPQITFAFAAMPSILAIVLATTPLRIRRDRKKLMRWADENSLVVRACQYRLLFRGPFVWNTPFIIGVFRVDVMSLDSIAHAGWVRCGTNLWTRAGRKRIDTRW